MAFRHIVGGWRRYIHYVDYAARNGNEAMARFRDCYRSLDRHRQTAWPEQLCEMANVAPGELIAAVCRAIWETMSAESSMISSMAQPKVLAATIKCASRPDGYRDRELFMRATGQLPDRKGTSINIFAQATGQAAMIAPDLAPGPPSRLKTFDDEIVEMSRDLESPDAPFVVRNNVSSDNH